MTLLETVLLIAVCLLIGVLWGAVRHVHALRAQLHHTRGALGQAQADLHAMRTDHAQALRELGAVRRAGAEIAEAAGAVAMAAQLDALR